jgi:hypothetical protein
VREELLLIYSRFGAENDGDSHAKLTVSQYSRNKKRSQLLDMMTKRFVLSFYIGARDPQPLPEVGVSLFCGEVASEAPITGYPIDFKLIPN